MPFVRKVKKTGIVEATDISGASVLGFISLAPFYEEEIRSRMTYGFNNLEKFINQVSPRYRKPPSDKTFSYFHPVTSVMDENLYIASDFGKESSDERIKREIEAMNDTVGMLWPIFFDKFDNLRFEQKPRITVICHSYGGTYFDRIIKKLIDTVPEVSGIVDQMLVIKIGTPYFKSSDLDLGWQQIILVGKDDNTIIQPVNKSWKESGMMEARKVMEIDTSSIPKDGSANLMHPHSFHSYLAAIGKIPFLSNHFREGMITPELDPKFAEQAYWLWQRSLYPGITEKEVAKLFKSSGKSPDSGRTGP